MPHYKLTYFNTMGRAEAIRLLFAQAEIPYDDVRIEKEQWPDLKPKTPFGQLPILEEDGKILSQSQAIATYLAKKFGLNGADDWEAAKIQELYGLFNDFEIHLNPWFAETDTDKKKAILDKLVTEKIPPLLDLYQKFLEQNGGEFYVGKKLTQIDIFNMCVFGFIKHVLTPPETFSKYPQLDQFYERIANLPNIKKWIETRPKTAI
jgi:glutathione S-transferase